MVTSGVVNGTKDKITTEITNYTSAIGELGGKWEGESYNKLNEQATTFADAFKSDTESKFSSFASCCDEYEKLKKEYDALKKLRDELKTIVDELNTLISTNEKGKNDSAITRKEAEKKSKETEIDTALEALKQHAQSIQSSVSGI